MTVAGTPLAQAISGKGSGPTAALEQQISSCELSAGSGGSRENFFMDIKQSFPSDLGKVSDQKAAWIATYCPAA